MTTPVTGDAITSGTTVSVPQVDDATAYAPTQASTAPVAPFATDTVQSTTPAASGIARINSPQAQEQIERAAVDAQRNGEPSKAPSFFQTLLEIVEFVARCFFPIVNLISAAIRIGRLIFDVLSDKNKEHIDWTRELVRIGGDLLAAIPGLGGVLSAVANTGLNYAYAKSDKPQGAQILGGVNYYVNSGPGYGEFQLGPDKTDSVSYYANKVWNGAKNMVSGLNFNIGVAPATAAPMLNGPTVMGADPYATSVSYTANGGPVTSTRALDTPVATSGQTQQGPVPQGGVVVPTTTSKPAVASAQMAI